MVSLESDARFVFELEKEWGSMPPDKKLDGEHEVPEFVLLYIGVTGSILIGYKHTANSCLLCFSYRQ